MLKFLFGANDVVTFSTSSLVGWHIAVFISALIGYFIAREIYKYRHPVKTRKRR